MLFSSCNKTSSTIKVDDLPSVNKWILVETLSDPGDGSGKWKTVDQPNYFFIKFNTDNSIETNIYKDFGGLTQYKIINDSTINLIYANGYIITRLYKIEGSLLKISGGCFEACGQKFKADF